MTYRKKLIEVALPLDAINRACIHEKSVPRRGHPATMHVWWARRPLAACRAILFASLVDDPGNDLPEEEATKERDRLFAIIEELVKWENTHNEKVIQSAQDEIVKSTQGHPPAVLDPFCGGGSIPLEALRLGLQVYASDLNPVPTLITKALTEIPSKFIGRPPINTEGKRHLTKLPSWKGTTGLAADIRYYGKWAHDKACKNIGHLYPKGPHGEAVIAWLWVRRVKCPSPACAAQMPLTHSFWLCNKKGRETWVNPTINTKSKKIQFEVKSGNGKPPDGTVNRNGARCIFCGATVPFNYIRSEGRAGRMDQQLMAIVAAGQRSRLYLPPSIEHEDILTKASPAWVPDTLLPDQALGFRVQLYGMTKHADLFTNRQLTGLNAFCELIKEVHNLVLESSSGDKEYADAVITYLSFAVDKLADWNSSICTWITSIEGVKQTFAKHALPMTWDFAETNPLGPGTGNWLNHVEWVANMVEALGWLKQGAHIYQLDAASTLPEVNAPFIFTDPPYYDNIGYADLSDLFYIWLRRNLKDSYPDIFSTLLTPKTQELIASPFRFDGDSQLAEHHFENGLAKAFDLFRRSTHPQYPVVLYYAFKQAENYKDENSTLLRSSTGWQTMLEGLLQSGFQVVATWPMRTERSTGLKANVNALASSIVIASRPRPVDAPIATRREFLSALKKELPEELRLLMNGRIAPVDLAQAAIGPGMAGFSRYSKVLEADGSTMTVRTALQEINYFLEDFLAQQEGDLDVESQFCIAWFQQYGSREGPYGEADVLARAKNIGVEGLARLGLMDTARGKVRLTLREDYEDGWDPQTQSRLTAWEACQRLVWTLNENGEQDAGRLARRLGGLADQARELAYRLYGIADRKGWAEEALGYNALVASWPEIQEAAAQAAEETQGRIV